MPAAEPVLTLADLDNWAFSGTALAVLGHPIKHSISPAMHNAALGVMAADDPQYGAWRYFRFDVHPDHLAKALPQFHAKGFRGINLTVPHKILAYSRVASVDPAARPVGAVNTLRTGPDGWQGFNTDGYGLATAVREDLGLDLAGTPIVLLGAGGAARGAAVECLQRSCASLWIGNRTRANLDALLAQLAPIAGNIPLQGFDPSTLAGLPPHALVINATSAGLKDTDPMPVDLARVPHPVGVYDMIYNPPLTPLLSHARALGLAHANGLSMLIHQGARALEIWTGRPVPVDAMRKAARAELGGCP